MPGSKAHPFQVFVSHATADKWLATMVCEKITATGATFFRDDEQIAAGDKIPDEIRNAIRRSKEMVVLFSPASKDRTWVHAEIGAAWLLKRRIIVVLCHTDMNSVPAMLAGEKAIDINQLPTYLTELKERMRATSRTKSRKIIAKVRSR